MFCALCHVSPRHDPPPDIVYRATMTCISMKPRAEPAYRGHRPSSSEKGAENNGTIPKPRGYTLNPSVARICEQFKSLIIEGIPEEYEDAVAALIVVK